MNIIIHTYLVNIIRTNLYQTIKLNITMRKILQGSQDLIDVSSIQRFQFSFFK